MSNGNNTANILAALNAAGQLAPVAAGLIDAVTVATTEGRDLTDEELQAGAALDAAVAAAESSG